MTPDEYCLDRAAKSGSSFYYSFRFLDETRRRAILALYAFCREVDDIVDECSDTQIARQKLDWWKDEIDRMFLSEPGHPVTKALHPHLQPFGLAQEYFHEIIDGMSMDLNQSTYQNFSELSLYCYRVASVVGMLSVHIFGFENRDTLKYAHDLGMAFQLTNILRDVREDAERGRIYMPLDQLETFGVSENDLLTKATPDRVRDLLQSIAERAREFYASAMNHLADVDRYAQRSGIVMAQIYLATLDEIERDGFRVLEHRISLTPIRKLWIAWSTARREKNRFRKNNRQVA